MAIDVAALEAEAKEAEQAERAADLSEDEQRAATAIARREKAIEGRAAAEKTRRVLDMAIRERRARDALGAKVPVKGIDLVDYFPLGKAPPVEQLPGGGVIIARCPPPDRLKTFQSEAEHRGNKQLADIFTDLVCESTVDPDPAKDSAGGAILRAFCENYPAAASQAGTEIVRLGGAKAQADKRGRV